MKQVQGLLQVLAGELGLLLTPRQQAPMEPGEGETGVQVGGPAVLVLGAAQVAELLPAERQDVMGAGIKVIRLEQLFAGRLRFVQAAQVGKKDRAQEQ